MANPSSSFSHQTMPSRPHQGGSHHQFTSHHRAPMHHNTSAQAGFGGIYISKFIQFDRKHFYSHISWLLYSLFVFLLSGHSQSGGMPSYSSNAPSGDLMYYPDQRSSHPANRSRHHPGASTHLSDVSYPISSHNRTHMFSARQQQPQAPHVNTLSVLICI